jgi:transcriptional regulator
LSNRKICDARQKGVADMLKQTKRVLPGMFKQQSGDGVNVVESVMKKNFDKTEVSLMHCSLQVLSLLATEISELVSSAWNTSHFMAYRCGN